MVPPRRRRDGQRYRHACGGGGRWHTWKRARWGPPCAQDAEASTGDPGESNFATVFFCTRRRPLALRHPPTAVAYADLGAGDAMGRDLQPRSPGFRAPGDLGAAGAGQPDGGRTRRPLRRLRLEPLHGPGDPQPTRQVTVHPGQARRGPSVCESRTNPTPLLSTWTPASGAATSLSPVTRSTFACIAAAAAPGHPRHLQARASSRRNWVARRSCSTCITQRATQVP